MRVFLFTVRARKAVISNATVWDTLKLLPEVKHLTCLVLNYRFFAVYRLDFSMLTPTYEVRYCGMKGAVDDVWRKERAETPSNESFIHMHLGIDATGLPADLECHHLIVNSWSNLRYTLLPPRNVLRFLGLALTCAIIRLLNAIVLGLQGATECGDCIHPFRL
jgi:hypothetical protein